MTGVQTCALPIFLNLTDAEVFPASRLGEDFYRRRAGDRARILSSRPFVRRGESVAVLLHPWTLERAFPPAPVRRAGTELPPELRPGDEVSIALWLPRKGPSIEALAIGDLQIPLTRTAERGKMARLITPRLRLPEGADRIAVPVPAGTPPRRWRVEVFRWRSATAAAGPRSPGPEAPLRPPH